MTGVEIETALDGAPEFVADAVEHLAQCLAAGRSVLAPANGRTAVRAAPSSRSGHQSAAVARKAATADQSRRRSGRP